MLYSGPRNQARSSYTRKQSDEVLRTLILLSASPNIQDEYLLQDPLEIALSPSSSQGAFPHVSPTLYSVERNQDPCQAAMVDMA